MIAGDMLAQILLITGWAIPDGAGWQVFDPAPGDASAWTAASPEDAAALTETLATYPTIARIHAGILSRADGHRASCASLRSPPCDCKETP